VERVGDTPSYTASLLDRHWLAPGILELRLTRPEGVAFIPGQFLRLLWMVTSGITPWFPHRMPRRSIFASPWWMGGRFSSDILKAEIGILIPLTGPHGHFVFQGPVNPAVFVATGTGVAPFVAFCRSGVDEARLIHGVGTPDRLIYRDLLQSALQEYVPCISRPSENMDPSNRAFSGRVTDYLGQRLKPGTYDFYLCGRRSMIRDAAAIVDDRFGDSRLFIETYD
jgi:benzoate/toluate 1,2-dioxygenase reductase subunit